MCVLCRISASRKRLRCVVGCRAVCHRVVSLEKGLSNSCPVASHRGIHTSARSPWGYLLCASSSSSLAPHTSRRFPPLTRAPVTGCLMSAPRFVSGGDDDFDDPATCGTFALRRLCVCGIGFALLPPASGAASATTAEKRRQLKSNGAGTR